MDRSRVPVAGGLDQSARARVGKSLCEILIVTLEFVQDCVNVAVFILDSLPCQVNFLGSPVKRGITWGWGDPRSYGGFAGVRAGDRVVGGGASGHRVGKGK